MADLFRYVVFDLEQDRNAAEFERYEDAHAIEEFEMFYCERIGSKNWETRTFHRYFLVKTALVVGCEYRRLPEPVGIMEDWQVRIGYRRFRMADPPIDDEAEKALEAEFDRIDALDVARIERWTNALKVDG